MMSEARSHKNRSLFVVTYTTLQPARAVLLPVMTIGDESLRGLQSKSLPEKAARKTSLHYIQRKQCRKVTLQKGCCKSDVTKDIVKE